jgi:hypothetical protein
MAAAEFAPAAMASQIVPRPTPKQAQTIGPALASPSVDLPAAPRFRELPPAFRRPYVQLKSLATTRVMTSRSHACAGWLPSRRSQIMAASIGLGGRDSR